MELLLLLAILLLLSEIKTEEFTVLSFIMLAGGVAVPFLAILYLMGGFGEFRIPQLLFKELLSFPHSTTIWLALALLEITGIVLAFLKNYKVLVLGAILSNLVFLFQLSLLAQRNLSMILEGLGR